jgi:carbamoyl-phosphate synthase large subunit
MQHIEEAGIHSGDSACSLPPFSLEPEIVEQIGEIAVRLAMSLGVRGLMNVQMALKDGKIFILEVNPRASRTVPFVAKAIGVPVARIASRVMAGERLADQEWPETVIDHVAVKEAVFPFSRFPGVDLLLGPEMKSTGEVMGIDRDFATAFAKSQAAAGVQLPRSGRVFLSVRDGDKPEIAGIARQLADLGFELCATGGTARVLHEAGIRIQPVLKVSQGRPNIVDIIKDGEIALVINTTEGQRSIRDSFSLRQAALEARLPYYTTISAARALSSSLAQWLSGDLEVAPLQSYLQRLH